MDSMYRAIWITLGVLVVLVIVSTITCYTFAMAGLYVLIVVFIVTLFYPGNKNNQK